MLTLALTQSFCPTLLEQKPCSGMKMMAPTTSRGSTTHPILQLQKKMPSPTGELDTTP